MPICIGAKCYYVKAKDKNAFIQQKLKEAREEFQRTHPLVKPRRSFNSSGEEITIEP